ncbi:amino acid adenylation domain-containing protein [Methylomonas rapida]|uniref:Amino acid adenylation domain-containing protein n=1 Tax=Methylomonas rapida TaxID=2963939 RepID=A0ABY7GPI4_9GAMM|nr:amino acid adenylation domain-containing protein [Methylomonas rapida]WAR46427.1 amino acid adenylation domain-containing protein [Methylomonas rapida]
MLLEDFLTQCQRQPDALCFQEAGRGQSYAQVLRQAQAIAASLQAHGIHPGQTVALHLDRGMDAAMAIFGVLLAGACYVPLDLKNPPSRLAFIVENAQVAAVIGQGSAPAWRKQGLWLNIASSPDKKPAPVEIRPDALAAILYTSGSTGQPRGVALSHAAIKAFADWAATRVNLSSNDRIASSTPFFFDLSTFDLYAVPGRGASLHFLPAALTMAPARLSAWLAEQAISGWYTVPSLLAFLAYKGNLAQTPLPSLRFLFFAGEAFPSPALMNLARNLAQTELFNFFGPTETNVCCYWPVKRSQLSATQNIPIGKPAAGCTLRIDPETGELWVRGPTLASGYWSQGGLHPFLNEQGWYATGDRVSLKHGEYHFYGRLSRMLKCSGYRVEPAEIEAIVNALPGVKECAVIGIEDEAAGQRPALAVVLEPGRDIGEIRKALLPRLPAYMQPSRYHALPALPRLANEKLDFRQLQSMFVAGLADSQPKPSSNPDGGHV